MKPPRLLLGACLIFWGWQTKLWILAILMAMLLEGARVVRLRWDFSVSDFNRISDVCALIFFGMILWLFFSTEPVRIIFIAMRWLPLSYFPLMIFQEYSAASQVDIRALSLILRKQSSLGKGKVRTIDLTYPYMILCVLSAGAANVRTPWFYAGLFVLGAWGLWSIRSVRFSPILWISLIMLAGVGGYAGHVGLHQLQIILEQKGLEWFSDLSRKDADPFQSITAIGDIGTLKLSDRILFRVKPEPGEMPGAAFPILLREASYDRYDFSKWFALYAVFITMPSQPDKTTWNIGPISKEGKTLTISSYLRKGKGLLTLPLSVFQIRDLPVSKMESNFMGAVRVEGGPRLVSYKVRYDLDAPNVFYDGLPDKNDLIVSEREWPAISEIAEELAIVSKPPEIVLRDVADFFQKNFEYSLTQDPRGHAGMTELADFLRQSRSGHCEHFATAATLLLRAAGIPARYAVGYLAHEFSPLENTFVVRERDAHAWTLVYLSGSWHNFDATPRSWTSIEADAAPAWEFLSDIWSWGMFRFTAWRWAEGEDRLKKHIGWLLIPLTLMLVRRLCFKKRMTRVRTEETRENEALPMPGADSEFYLIEKRLNEQGIERHPGETLRKWMRRTQDADDSGGHLRSLLRLHYRYRFDPNGIGPDDKERLRTGVRAWLVKHEEGQNPSVE